MLWFTSRKRNTLAPAARLARSAESTQMFERLEERIVFYVGPMLTGMPDLGLLENDNNSVVRMHTNMGNIDIELFDQQAPITVQNFKRYIQEGRLDETIFHRLVPGFVLQGGGYTFHDDVGVTAVDTHPPIQNEFSRLNLEGTIAMAKLAGDPHSATSQFFFNLVDNPSLDTQNGGFTVFGRVVQGWNIVQTIAGLNTQDLNQEFIGQPTGAFTDVPVQGGFDPGVGPTEDTLVRITDIELIKTWGSKRFFIHNSHISEGFSGAEVVERIDLHNQDREVPNFYQIIVRYENGLRDQVISSGVLQGGEKRSFKVADVHFPAYEVVRPNEPYSIEVRSTRALGAALNRRDFGATVSESFINVMGIRHSELLHWRLSGGEKGADMRSFVTYQNITPNHVHLNIAVYSEDGTVRYIQRELEPFRRGGLEIHNIGVISEGRFSVQINAVGGAIVAGLTQYNLGEANASMNHGAFNGGATQGILAGAIIPSDGESFVDFFYAGHVPAQVMVDLTYIRTGGQTETSTVILNTIERSKRVNLGQLFTAIPQDEYFSLRYSVQFDQGKVAGTFTARTAGDEFSTAFQTAVTGTIGFADGYTDPALIDQGGMNEVISVHNPYTGSSFYSYQMVFKFADGTAIWSPIQSLAANARADHRAWDFSEVRDKIQEAPQFRFYSVQIISTQFQDPIVPGTAVVAQMTRTHNTWQQALATQPSSDARLAVQWLDQPHFR